MSRRTPNRMQTLVVGVFALAFAGVVILDGFGILGPFSGAVACGLWFSLVLALGVIGVFAARGDFGRLRDMFRFMARSTESALPSHVAQVIEDCCIRLGIERTPDVRTIPSPALNAMAVSRAALLLSEGLVADLPVEQLRIVIAHLLCRQRDDFGGTGDAGVPQPQFEGTIHEVLTFESHLVLAKAADLRVLRLFLDDGAMRRAYERVLRGDHHVDSPLLFSLGWFAWPSEGGESEYEARMSALREAAGASGAVW